VLQISVAYHCNVAHGTSRGRSTGSGFDRAWFNSILLAVTQEPIYKIIIRRNV